MKNFKKRLLILVLLFFIAIPGGNGERGNFITIRRDAEIEATLKDFILPIFKVAGLNSKVVRFFIVINQDINAAAGAGSLIFLNTGFLLAAKSAAQVVGVLAHETGHIAGGHHARIEESIKNHSLAMAAMMVLGVTGGLATSNPDLAMAGLMGSFHLGERAFLHYSRTQESSADQAGAKYLRQLGWPIAGAVDFMRMVDRQESLIAGPQNPYLRTHPLWEERIRAMQEMAERNDSVILSPKKSPSKSHLPPDFEPRFQRIKAKLYAATYPLKETLKHYKGSTFVDLYAQATAHHLSGHLPHALTLVQILLSQEPRNPFLWELKGSILLDMGHSLEAEKAYAHAVHLFPKNGLLRISLARVLLDREKENLVQPAINHLIEARKTESLNPLLWHSLAIAYGRKGDIGHMALCLAEEAHVNGDMEMAKTQSERALSFLKPGTQAHLRARDISLDLKNRDDQRS